MNELDWTTEADLSMLTAEELGRALQLSRIRYVGCGYSEDDDCGRNISIAFRGIEAAEQAVILGVPLDHELGGLYDRATASCLTLTEFAAREDDTSATEVEDALDRGWKWTIHPGADDEGFVWHVSVDMSARDARELTANLNASRRAGA